MELLPGIFGTTTAEEVELSGAVRVNRWWYILPKNGGWMRYIGAGGGIRYDNWLLGRKMEVRGIGSQPGVYGPWPRDLNYEVNKGMIFFTSSTDLACAPTAGSFNIFSRFANAKLSYDSLAGGVAASACRKATSSYRAPLFFIVLD